MEPVKDNAITPAASAVQRSRAQPRRSIGKSLLLTGFAPALLSCVCGAAAVCALAAQCFEGARLATVCALAVCCALALGGAAFALSRRSASGITGRLGELTEIVRSIAAGSYGSRAAKVRNDELGDLVEAVNEVSQAISASERVRTEFISSVSHELRTPLTAITGWSETLSGDEALTGDSRRGVQIISKEAARLSKMVTELLEFTRIQDGRFNLSMERLDLECELEETVFGFAEALRRDGKTLIYEPDDEPLPPIDGDPERLRQVFLNIIDNAARHGHGGDRIIVASRRDGDAAEISVRDFGPGIPESELPHVKERFYKGSSKERGSGIGLAVCDEIITRHKGTLEIANAEGGGTVVTVRLPAAKD